MVRRWSTIFVLLLVAATAAAHTESLASSHSENHASHCCGVCHAGHLSILQAVAHFSVIAPLSVLSWYRPDRQLARAIESQLILDLSRAPPA
jgi:hypothetical protein